MTRPSAIRCVSAVAALVAVAVSAFGQNPSPECEFLPGTAIPRLVMGVCRPGEPPEVRDRGELELWGSAPPSPDAEPIAMLPLFMPLYVYEERPGVGKKWYRVGDAYAALGERGTKDTTTGWVDGSRLHELTSRYAYHFRNPERVPPGVQLYESRKAAYAALAGQQGKPPVPDAGRDVLVTENLDVDEWDPLQAGAIPPFIELPDEPGADTERLLTDTTLTFPQPAENRLVRVGAVCGGPVKQDKLEALKKDAQARAGIEIVFVIDETVSMQPAFRQVAAFIEQNLAGEGDMTNVKVAVSWYSDQTEKSKNEPFMVEALAPIVGPGVDAGQVQDAKKQIVKKVRDHAVNIVAGDVNPRELVFQGLEAAINEAGLANDANKMVFVIGDAGDRSDAAELEKHYGNVAALVLKHKLQLAFIQVGDPNEPDQKPDPAFAEQARKVQEKLPAAEQAAVVVEEVDNQKLALRIADIQARMEAKRRKLEREIARFESRNRYTLPGPLMKQRIQGDGLTPEQFDEKNLQYFAPAYGWLYHPQQPEGEPQLRELVFMAKPEVDALMATLITVAEQLEKQGRVDGDAALEKFAAVVAKNSGHSKVADALRAAWKSMPEEKRNLGEFLRDKVGLRVRSSILYHRGATKPTPATAQAAALLREHKSRLFGDRDRAATRPGLPPPVWHDSWKVLP